MQELNFLNEAFLIEAEENKTWDGGRLNWNKVIVPSQWSKFQNYKTGTVDGLFNKLEEKHSGVVIVDSQNAVIEGAGVAKFGAGNPEDEED